MKAVKNFFTTTLFTLCLSTSFLVAQSAYKSVAYDSDFNIYQKLKKASEESDLIIEGEIVDFDLQNLSSNKRQILTVKYKVYEVIKGELSEEYIETVFDTKEYLNSLLSSMPKGFCANGIYDNPPEIVPPSIGKIGVVFFSTAGKGYRELLNSLPINYSFHNGCKTKEQSSLNYACIDNVKSGKKYIFSNTKELKDFLKKKDK